MLGRVGSTPFARIYCGGPGGIVERGYCFPSAGVAEAFTRLVIETRVDVVLVLPVVARPWPGWRDRIERHVRRTLPLPADFAQKRGKETGWFCFVGPAHEALVVAF